MLGAAATVAVAEVGYNLTRAPMIPGTHYEPGFIDKHSSASVAIRFDSIPCRRLD